ncbi:hypothetical protein [Geoalkalibacter halelectricus]|uniref:hypothetical protein n=1 Tax=Geoalkalibacter halelectricus TaxID=2847045 RepID=UPI003D249346
MRNHLLKILVVLVAAASLTLGGCGGSGSSGPQGPAVETLDTGLTLMPVQDGDPNTSPAVFAVPAAINDGNLIIGSSEIEAGGTLKPVWWQVDADGRVIRADEPLALHPRSLFAAALGLNNNELIVGMAGVDRAAAWAGVDALPVLLPTLAGGGDTAAFAVNGSGRIVGEAENNAGFFRAVYWQQAGDGTITMQPVLPGVPAEWDAAAYAINNSNTIAGELIDASGISRAAIWRLVGGNYVRLDLPTLADYTHAAALGLNNPAPGEPLLVVGEVAEGIEVRAVAWEVAADGSVSAAIDLGANGLDSRAEAVNDAGLIAGWENDRAVVWETAVPTRLLNVDSKAFDINNENLAVGRKGNQGFVIRVN